MCLLCKGSLKVAKNEVLKLCTGTMGHQDSRSLNFWKMLQMQYIEDQFIHRHLKKDVNLLENNLTLDQVNLDWPCAGLMKRRPCLNIKTTTFNSHLVFCRSQFPWYNFKRNDSTVQSVFSTFPLQFRCQNFLRQCGAFLHWKCLVSWNIFFYSLLKISLQTVGS